MSDTKATGMNSSVVRALDILELLSVSGQPLSLAEICQELALNRVTCASLIKTLQYKRYVYRTHNNKYLLSGKNYVLGNLYKLSFPVVKPFEEIGTQIASELGIELNLAVMCEMDRAIIISNLPNRRGFLLENEPYIPMYCTACGKALLAFQDWKQVLSIVGRLQFNQYTDRTVTDPAQLLEELQEIRRNGYSVDDRQYMDHRCCLGAPVFGRDNAVVASISFSGIHVDGDVDDTVRALLPRLLDFSRALSYEMGQRAINASDL